MGFNPYTFAALIIGLAAGFSIGCWLSDAMVVHLRKRLAIFTDCDAALLIRSTPASDEIHLTTIYRTKNTDSEEALQLIREGIEWAEECGKYSRKTAIHFVYKKTS